MKKKLNIIAIDPGLREMGFAHFEGGELVDYGVKSLKRLGNHDARPMLFKKIVLRMFKEKKPDIAVIEKNSFTHIPQNQALMSAINGTRLLAKKLSIKVVEFAPNTIKKFVTGDGRASKHIVAQVLCARYPELRLYHDLKRSSRERYYQNQFDAIACGLTFLNSNEQNDKRTH